MTVGAAKVQADQTMVLAWQALIAEARQGGDQMAVISAIGAIGYMIRVRGIQEAVRDAAVARRNVLPPLPLSDFGPYCPLSSAELEVQIRALAAVSRGDVLLDGMPVSQRELALRIGARVVSEDSSDDARRLATLGVQLDIDGASPLRDGQAPIAHRVLETMAD